MAHFYIVSTPIGNLGDMTRRAVEVLGEVDRILAEDTRRTSILLREYGIETPLVSAHAHNEAARTSAVLEWLAAGEDLALVSDAGTPLLSDPGARMVEAVIEAGVPVVPVPGASALLAALVASGMAQEPFTFYGFLPRSGGARGARLAELRDLGHTAVVYESPNRLVRLLEELVERCDEGRRVAVARELTKRYESIVRGTLAEALDYYRTEGVRGEVVVVLEGRTETAEDRAAVEAGARALTRELCDAGVRPSHVARQVAQQTGIARNRAYEIALEVSEELEREDSAGGDVG